MKKAALYLGILTISTLFYACDAERENAVYTGPDQETNDPALKLSKMTERDFVYTEIDSVTTDIDTSATETLFTYDHNGLLTKTDNGGVRNEISYSGTKKITTIDTYAGSGLTTNQFNYSGDKLVNVIAHGTQETKVVYSYTDKNVTSKDYFEIENSGYVKKKSVHYTFVEGNATEEDETNYAYGDTINVHHTFTFDQKPHPYTFLNQYLKLFSGFEALAPWNIQNKLTSSSIDPDDVDAEAVNYTYTVTTSAQSSYPTSIKMMNADGVVVKEWLFEYVETASE